MVAVDICVFNYVQRETLSLDYRGVKQLFPVIIADR